MKKPSGRAQEHPELHQLRRDGVGRRDAGASRAHDGAAAADPRTAADGGHDAAYGRPVGLYSLGFQPVRKVFRMWLIIHYYSNNQYFIEDEAGHAIFW